MKIRGKFICSNCDYTRVIDSQYIGEILKCPNCQSPGIVKEINNDDSENIQEVQKSEKLIKKARFVCESCGYTKEVNAKYIGIQCKCPECKNTGEIKEVTEEKSEKVKETKGKFICKSCGYTKEVDAKHIGIQCKCPECKNIGEIIAASDVSLSHDTVNNEDNNSLNDSTESIYDENYEQIDLESFSKNLEKYMLPKKQQAVALLPFLVKKSNINSIEIVEAEYKNNDIIEVQAHPSNKNNKVIRHLKNTYDKYAPELQNKIEDIKDKISENIPVFVKNVREFDYEKTKNNISERAKGVYFNTVDNMKGFWHENVGSMAIIFTIFLFICITLSITSYNYEIKNKDIIDKIITNAEYVDDNQFKILQSDIINEVNTYIDENSSIYKDALSWIASTNKGNMLLGNFGQNHNDIINIYTNGIEKIVNKHIDNFYYELEYNNIILLFELLGINNKFDNKNIYINKPLTQDKKFDINMVITDHLVDLGLELSVNLHEKIDKTSTVISLVSGGGNIVKDGVRSGAKTGANLISKSTKEDFKKIFTKLSKNIQEYLLNNGIKTSKADNAMNVAKILSEFTPEKQSEIIKNYMKNIILNSLNGKDGLYDYLNMFINNFHKKRRKKILDNF